MVAKNVMQNPRIMCGGGSHEMAVSRYVLTKHISLYNISKYIKRFWKSKLNANTAGHPVESEN